MLRQLDQVFDIGDDMHSRIRIDDDVAFCSQSKLSTHQIRLPQPISGSSLSIQDVFVLGDEVWIMIEETLVHRQTLANAMCEACATVLSLSLATATMGKVNEKRIASLHIVGGPIRVNDVDTVMARMIAEGICDGPDIVRGHIVIDR